MAFIYTLKQSELLNLISLREQGYMDQNEGTVSDISKIMLPLKTHQGERDVIHSVFQQKRRASPGAIHCGKCSVRRSHPPVSSCCSCAGASCAGASPAGAVPGVYRVGGTGTDSDTVTGGGTRAPPAAGTAVPPGAALKPPQSQEKNRNTCLVF